jgi:hypothetical protein
VPIAYCVPPKVLLKFKKPYGTLVEGSFSKTMQALETIVKTEKPSKIISVGDTVTRNLHQQGIIPQLSITDNKSMRKQLQPVTFPEKNLVKIKNPQGLITEEAIAAIRNALAGNKATHILVEGEEDLLTLIAVVYAPENALVIYGQPQKGVVVVKVTPEKRVDAEKIFKAMKSVGTE